MWDITSWICSNLKVCIFAHNFSSKYFESAYFRVDGQRGYPVLQELGFDTNEGVRFAVRALRFYAIPALKAIKEQGA